MSVEVSLSEMLYARERRVQHQQMLFAAVSQAPHQLYHEHLRPGQGFSTHPAGL